jgi:hypothetical protein
MSFAVGAMLLSLTACGKDPGKTTDTGKGNAATPGGPAPVAATTPKDLIVGTWQLVEMTPVKKSDTFAKVSGSPAGKSTVEFKADGTVVLASEFAGKVNTVKGKYTFLENKVLEIQVEPPESGKPKMTQKFTVTKVDKDELVTQDESDVNKYKRLK